MGMGQSAGRSEGNRVGEGAIRRNTQRERAAVDPPWDHEPVSVVDEWKLTPRGERWAQVCAITSMVSLACMIAVVFAAYLDVI